MEEQLKLPIQEGAIVDRFSPEEKERAVDGFAEAMMAYLSDMVEEKGGEHE